MHPHNHTSTDERIASQEERGHIAQGDLPDSPVPEDRNQGVPSRSVQQVSSNLRDDTLTLNAAKG